MQALVLHSLHKNSFFRASYASLHSAAALHVYTSSSLSRFVYTSLCPCTNIGLASLCRSRRRLKGYEEREAGGSISSVVEPWIRACQDHRFVYAVTQGGGIASPNTAKGETSCLFTSAWYLNQKVYILLLLPPLKLILLLVPDSGLLI